MTADDRLLDDPTPLEEPAQPTVPQLLTQVRDELRALPGRLAAALGRSETAAAGPDEVDGR